MKTIVTHTAPDLDAITSVWVIKRFLPGWENAQVKFVSAGDRINLSSEKISPEDYLEPIEIINDNEVIHVDTGLGALDHHQISSDKVCAASLSWDYVRKNSKIKDEKIPAVDKIIDYVVVDDHFKQVFREDSAADYHEFELDGILEGLKYQHPGKDELYIDFIMECLDAVLHNFENRIWAEKEIEENGKTIESKFGKVLAIETMNDSVIKLSQLKGYDLVVKKDPKYGHVRIKASPKANIDLTSLYNEIKKVDPKASWYLHVGKKMLLNGSSKSRNSVASKLSIGDIINLLEKL